METDTFKPSCKVEDRVFLFKLEEYKSLRQEIDTRVKEAFSLIIYCLTAIFAAYGGFFGGALSISDWAKDHPFLRHLPLYVAMFFPLFGLVKSREAWDNVLRIADHLRTLEADFGLEGWEHKAQRHRDRALAESSSDFSQPPYTLFWIALIAATALIALEGLLNKI